MGQQCSALVCRHVENPVNAEMSRVDSPDPVMYDLMRKSIQATALLNDGTNNSSSTVSGSSKSAKRRPIGQSHLLYKNNPKTAPLVPPTTLAVQNPHRTPPSPLEKEDTSNIDVAPPRAVESRNCAKSTDNVATAEANNSNNTNSSNTNSSPREVSVEEKDPSTVSKCPTRLLIRRRSLRVVEEGGGTHIYAIRYPEDTAQMIVSEQAAPLTPVATQEQCPPRKPAAVVSTSNSSAASLSPTLTISADSSSPLSNLKASSPAAVGGKGQSTSSSNDANNNKNINSKKGGQSSNTSKSSPSASKVTSVTTAPSENAKDVFTAASMGALPRRTVLEWVTVSEEHNIYVADVGLTAAECDELVATTEQACKGQYAAYTYAKQTLGCREYPILAQSAFSPVHTIVHAITDRFPLNPPSSATESTEVTKNTNDKENKDKTMATTAAKDSDNAKEDRGQNEKDPHRLQLDDREPHIVKYDVTKKERQKLDMHTDKSEWTFLIALSNGCGVDYEGGGTYFECLDATVHIQRGHALVFPGKLRHCGQKITSGLRFLLVGFLVDKQTTSKNSSGGGKTSSSKSSGDTAAATNASSDKPKDKTSALTISADTSSTPAVKSTATAAPITGTSD